MVCAVCGASLDESAAFPGATLRCSCGGETRLPSLPAPVDKVSPYREAAPAPVSHGFSHEAAMITCPFCGAPCGSDTRVCPHCDVELAAVRCPTCFALHFTGARFCSSCRAALHPELLLDASDAPCPRCATPLGNTPDAGIFDCRRCGGLFVDHTAFAALAKEREAEAGPHAGRPPHPPVSSREAEVHYVKCPMCTKVMNRINFGRRSGVIVDVCGLHGTWFDRNELTEILEWIGSGALEDERMRQRAEHAKEASKAHAAWVQANERCEPRVSEGIPETVRRVLESLFLSRLR